MPGGFQEDCVIDCVWRLFIDVIGSDCDKNYANQLFKFVYLNIGIISYTDDLNILIFI